MSKSDMWPELDPKDCTCKKCTEKRMNNTDELREQIYGISNETLLSEQLDAMMIVTQRIALEARIDSLEKSLITIDHNPYPAWWKDHNHFVNGLIAELKSQLKELNK